MYARTRPVKWYHTAPSNIKGLSLQARCILHKLQQSLLYVRKNSVVLQLTNLILWQSLLRYRYGWMPPVLYRPVCDNWGDLINLLSFFLFHTVIHDFLDWFESGKVLYNLRMCPKHSILQALNISRYLPYRFRILAIILDIITLHGSFE